MGSWFETSKKVPSGTPLSHILILPKQSDHWGRNIQKYEPMGPFPFKPPQPTSLHGSSSEANRQRDKWLILSSSLTPETMLRENGEGRVSEVGADLKGDRSVGGKK